MLSNDPIFEIYIKLCIEWWYNFTFYRKNSMKNRLANIEKIYKNVLSFENLIVVKGLYSRSKIILSSEIHFNCDFGSLTTTKTLIVRNMSISKFQLHCDFGSQTTSKTLIVRKKVNFKISH